MGEFTYEKDADGIVTVTMNMDGPVNSMNKEFRLLYSDMVNKLEAEEGLKGVILTSGKETFCRGRSQAASGGRAGSPAGPV